jgi:hypothetical protein
MVLKYLMSAGAIAITVAATVPARADYVLTTTIPVPASPDNVQPGGVFSSFDISFFDPFTQLDYVADRSNASVDIFSAQTNTFVGRIGGTGNLFTGQQATTSTSGPDGVVVVNQGVRHQVFVGDGGSTVRAFNIVSPTNNTPAFTTNTGGGVLRADEMAFSPLTNSLLVANNANLPAFATLINATNGAILKTNITIPGAAPTGGMEQPVWNPTTQTFFVSIPSFNGVDAGGVAEIHADGTLGRLYNFTAFGIASASPTGLALGASGNLLVAGGASGSQAVLLNPTGTGSIVKTFPQISGSDEVWYDPATARFFVTGIDPSGNRVITVIDDTTQQVLQTIQLGVSPLSNPHSVAVDPISGESSFHSPARQASYPTRFARTAASPSSQTTRLPPFPSPQRGP